VTNAGVGANDKQLADGTCSSRRYQSILEVVFPRLQSFKKLAERKPTQLDREFHISLKMVRKIVTTHINNNNNNNACVMTIN
jgi:hypothetical protein